MNPLTTSQENSGASWSQTNAYDRYGNRWIDLGGGNQSLYFNSNNRITNSGYSYDAAGNLLNDGVHAYTFDAENKISKVDNVSAYTYDGEGQRVRKLVGENLRFVYGIGGQMIAEFDGSNGSLKKEYIPGGASLITIEPTALNANGTRYSTSDHLGSPRVITNFTAGVVSRHDYKPFGEDLGSGIGGRTTGMGFSVADGVRQQFTSKERDIETGLHYFLARYYSSTQGRFTSTDPLSASGSPNIPQGWNRYSYVLNNPLKLVDPDGMMWIYHFLDKKHTRIGIAWIDGNKISKGLKAQGYQALNLGSNGSRAIALTNGSIVRFSAGSSHAEVLRGPQQSGDRAYVNTGLINELGRQTAPMPKAVGLFILFSVNGGYAVAGSTILAADAAAYALYAAHAVNEQEQNPQVMASTSSQYQDITKGRSIRNIQTDVSKSEFIQNLADSGYSVTRQGNETILDNGTNKYTVYDIATSTGGPAAARSVGGEETMKIRLKP